MTRDPLEELFGPLEPEEPRTEAQGVRQAAPAGSQPTAPLQAAAPRPAVQRQAREELPTRQVPAGKRGVSAALPWILVAAVAAAALIVALVVVNQGRGTTPEPENSAPATPTPSESATPSPSATPDEAEEPAPEEPEDSAPKAEVGANPEHMNVTFANISVDVSRNLGPAYWYVPGGPTKTVMFHTSLMGTFPDSCAAMRSVEGKSPWGIEEGADGKWTVIRPAGTCAADKALYNKVWGLMQAVADSAKPI